MKLNVKCRLTENKMDQPGCKALTWQASTVSIHWASRQLV